MEDSKNNRNMKKKIIIIVSCIFVLVIATCSWFLFGDGKKITNVNRKAQIDEKTGTIYLAQNEQFDLKKYYEINEKYADYVNYTVKNPYNNLTITDDLKISSSELGKSRIDIYDGDRLIDDFRIQVIKNAYLKTIDGLKIDNFDPQNNLEYNATMTNNTISAETVDSAAEVGICTEDELDNEKCEFSKNKVSRTMDSNISSLVIRVKNSNVRADYIITLENSPTAEVDTNDETDNTNSKENVPNNNSNNTETKGEQINETKTNNSANTQVVKELKCPIITSNVSADNWTSKDIGFTMNFNDSNANSYEWFTAQNVDSAHVNQFNWYLWESKDKKFDYVYSKYNGNLTKINTQNYKNTKKAIASYSACANNVCKQWIHGSGYRKINIRVYDANGKYIDCGGEKTYLIDKTVPKITVDAKNDGYKYDITVNANAGISQVKEYKYKLSDENQPRISVSNKLTVSPTKDVNLTIQACNNAGTCSDSKVITLKKTKTFMVTSKSKTKDGKYKNLNEGEWTNGDVVLTANTENLKNTSYFVKYSLYDNATKKWNAWKDGTKLSLTKEGKYIVKFGLYDTKAKKWVTSKDYKVNIDKTAPIINVNNPYKVITSNNTTPIKVTGNDKLSGIKQYTFRKEKGQWTKFGTNKATENFDINVLGIANKTNVSFSVTDKAGNVSNIANEVVNPINNSIAVECKLRNTTGKEEKTNTNYIYGVGINSKPNYTNKNVTCNAKTNINNANISYTIGNKTVNGSKVDIEKEGTTNIRFSAKAGNNTETIDIKVNIDKKVPTVPTLKMLKWISNLGVRPTRTTNHNNLSSTNYTTNTWSNKKVLVTPISEDKNGSGIDHYEYTTTGKTTNKTNQKGDYRNIEANGTSTIKYRACDKAGNCSAYTKPVTVKIDYNAPKMPTVNMYKWKSNDSKKSPTRSEYKGLLEGKYANNTWSNKIIFTTASSSDAESGIDHYEYTTTGKTTNKTNQKGDYRNIVANGTSTIKYRACDKAGNCSVASDVKTVNIDYTKPTCKPTQSKSGTTIAVKANCTDAESKVGKTQVYIVKGSATGKEKYQDGQWHNSNGTFKVIAYGTSTLKFKAQDKAGNWSNESTIKVNNPKPVVKNNYTNNYVYNSTTTEPPKENNKKNNTKNNAPKQKECSSTYTVPSKKCEKHYFDYDCPELSWWEKLLGAEPICSKGQRLECTTIMETHGYSHPC